MQPSYEVQTDVHVLPAFIPIPTVGLLSVNAFLVEAAQPYLVDTGLLVDSEELVRAVEAILDPADLRWIYLTHTDPDHVGALMTLLDRAPRAKVITTFLGAAKLELSLRPVPADRVLVRNPGERISIGDRTLSVMRPPIFDAAETTMVYDDLIDGLFSADAFGGPLPEPLVLANEIPDDRLEASQLTWAAVDAPWIHMVDRGRFVARVREVKNLDPAWVFSAHLPPARRMAFRLCQTLVKAPDAAPYAAPDQPAFEAIMREVVAAVPPA